MLSRRHRGDLLDVDLARDPVMTESDDDLCQELEPVPSLIGDQDAEALDPVFSHPDHEGEGPMSLARVYPPSCLGPGPISPRQGPAASASA